jgi:hypothetical protein
LFFELLLELGVGLLEVAEIVFEEPHLSSPLLLQLVKFSLEINVLRQLFGYAFVLAASSWWPLTITFSFSMFFCECLITSCIRGKIKTRNSTTYTGRRVIMSYHGKIVQLFGDLLEVSYVVVRQNRVIHQICGDDVLVSMSGHQQISRAPRGPCGFFS